MRFCTATLGCKANQYDTGTIETLMKERGCTHVKEGSGCDVYIINTCAVTMESVRKSRQAIRRAQKKEPNALIAVCGCYSQLDQSAVSELGADIIIGAGKQTELVDEITKTVTAKSRSPVTSDIQLSTAKTRALLKIQDGCNNGCAYCIIPHTRGPSRSVELSELAVKTRMLSEQGYKEIVITGIEISSYKPELIEALYTISTYSTQARLRLGSLNPDILTAGFIRKLKRIPNLCNHFHLSLQSGCDRTLANMGRAYDTDDVYKAVDRLRNAFDNCGITADLIVGFPGETDEDFEQTLRFIEKAAFSSMHIFPFSPRPGTKAYDMPDHVANNIKQVRTEIAAGTAAKLKEKFKRAQIGNTLEVLFEKTFTDKSEPRNADGKKMKYSKGHSSNYLTVAIPGKVPKNFMSNVKISGTLDNALFGEIV